MQEKLQKKIDSYTPIALELQKELTVRPAIPPAMGGDGEHKKAEFLIDWLKNRGIEEIQRIDVPDERVSAGVRPNVLVTLHGEKRQQSNWIVTHLDIVPAGDESAWDTPPYEAVEKNGNIYGRGTEDNQQGMISSILSLLALRELGLTPRCNLKLLFVTDEESGSEKGMKYLLKHHPQLFGRADTFIIPDGGAIDGSELQIAEKNIYVMKFTVLGKQCHAAVPGTGLNAFTAGSELVLELEGLNKRFAKISDAKFDPPISTFTPTRKVENVSASNIVPGVDQFFMDCRLLAGVDFTVLKQEIDLILRRVETNRKVDIQWEVVNEKISPPTKEDVPLVVKLQKAVNSVLGVDSKTVGIGGGTAAGILREDGYDAVVWSTSSGTAHMPNEYSPIANVINDAKVFCEFCLLD